MNYFRKIIWMWWSFSWGKTFEKHTYRTQ